MTDGRSESNLNDLHDEIDFYKNLISELDVNVGDYAETKSGLQGELNRLNLLFEKKQAEEQAEEHTRQYQEDLKFLEDSEAGKISESLATSPTRQHQLARSGYNSARPVGFSAYSGLQSGFGSHQVSGDVISRPDTGNASPSWNFASVDETFDDQANAKTSPMMDIGPISTSTSASASSPDQGSSAPSPPLLKTSGNSRKRQRESLHLPGLSDGHTAKNLRTTPSPAITGPTTPSSIDDFDFPEDSEFFRLMGGNPKEDMQEMREEQKAQEKMLRDKREQERKDEEFAKKLMEEEMSAAHPQRSQTWGASSPVYQSPSQTVLKSKATTYRPDPVLLSSSSPSNTQQDLPLSYGWPAGQESTTQDSLSQPLVKFENPRYHATIPSRSTTDFIDLASSDDYDTLGEDVINDLVEINPTAWPNDNKDVKPGRQLPWANKYGASNSNVGTNAWGQSIDQDLSSHAFPYAAAKPGLMPLNPYSNPYQGNTGYTGTNVYDATSATGVSGPSSWNNVAGQVGQVFTDAAKGILNAAYSVIDNSMNGQDYGEMVYGSSMYGNGLAGSSTNPHLVPDFDFDYAGQPSRSALNNVLKHNHSINADDPKNRELVDKYLERVNYLRHDPTRTSAEIKSLLENIRPDEDLPPENREGTPDAMTYPLMEHQKLGLAWMKSMEEGSNKGGILADDMGLGKTIQALALMVSRRSTDPRRKTTLIVAPVALMKQWEREIQQKLKPGRENCLTCYILHGSNRQTTWEHLKTFDVVLTTFGTLANEVKRKEGIDMAKRGNPNWRAMTKGDQLPLLGDECKWFRVIIDEAQCIKNKNTKAALGAASLQSLTRFCMSGTPMMNNVGELYSLIHFLRIKPYNTADNFNRDFTKPLKNAYEPAKDRAMQKLQALLKAILLRRTKKSKIDGKPILTLPERTTESQHAVFSEDEQAFYRALESQTQLQFNKYLKAGTVGRNYSNVLVLLLRLRQACCHPHLIKDHGMSSGVTDVSMADMLKLAHELAPDVVSRIKEQGGMNNQCALECPVCMDMAENATIFIPCGHSTCSECFARISDPSQAIAGGDAAEGRNVDIKCPNCRGKVVPSKIIDHNAFKKVHMPEESNSDASDPQASIETTDESDSDSEDESDDSDDLDDSESLKDFVVDDDDDLNDERESDNAESNETAMKGYGKGKTPFEKAAKLGKKKKSKKGKEKAKEKPLRKTLAELKKESRSSTKARKAYLKRLTREWVTSGKIEKVLEILQATQDRNEGEKTIIFSQFTSLLDLLEVPIYRKEWGYKRYDGSMSSNARNEAVIEFSDKPACKIMLVSLKAGNSGLNLVAASQVIIFDPFWNPYIEEQAIDRAHRIGQMRPVQVHRILVPQTVEDRILALQEKKRALIEGALDEKASQSIGRLGERELAFLFVSGKFNPGIMRSVLICIKGRSYPVNPRNSIIP